MSFPRRIPRRAFFASVAVWTAWFPGGCAFAGDPWQLWPEVGVYVGLSPATRLFFDLPYSVEGDTDTKSLELAAYFDVSLKPVLRRSLQEGDWARSRYFWMRFGFDHIFNVTNGEQDDPEERGVIEIRGRAPTLWEIWLEARLRADLRWIGGEYSTRYRFRIEANREFKLHGRPAVPYVNVEWFYDERYDAWSRTLYQAGAEFTFTDHFRFEAYVARQVDEVPETSGLYALGLFAKWYY